MSHSWQRRPNRIHTVSAGTSRTGKAELPALSRPLPGVTYERVEVAGKPAHLYVQYNQEAATGMITRKTLRDLGLIERVNVDRPVIDIVSSLDVEGRVRRPGEVHLPAEFLR